MPLRALGFWNHNPPKTVNSKYKGTIIRLVALTIKDSSHRPSRPLMVEGRDRSDQDGSQKEKIETKVQVEGRGERGANGGQHLTKVLC